MTKQLSIKRTNRQPTSRQASTIMSQTRHSARYKIASMSTRTSKRKLMIISIAAVCPGLVMMDGMAVIVAVNAISWVARITPNK